MAYIYWQCSMKFMLKKEATIVSNNLKYLVKILYGLRMPEGTRQGRVMDTCGVKKI